MLELNESILSMKGSVGGRVTSNGREGSFVRIPVYTEDENFREPNYQPDLARWSFATGTRSAGPSARRPSSPKAQRR
jgi:hypothetical protein